MDEDKKIERIKKSFWITFVIGVGTFLCPFLEGHNRTEVYWKIFEFYYLERRRAPIDVMIIITLVFSTLFWLPIMGYAFYKYTIKKRYYSTRQRMINYFLFGVGSVVYLLPLYALYDRGFSMASLRMFDWGYWVLLTCTIVLFACYINIQKIQLIDKDLSEHLIIDDKN